MKSRLIAVSLAFAFMCLAGTAFAQNTTIKGVIKDTEGKPIADVQITMHNNTSGQTVRLKSDKKGEFFSLGVTAGPYNIDFVKDGKSIWKLTNYPVTLQKDINEINVDLKKEAADPNNKPQMSEADKKEMEANIKENATIKSLNEMLAAAHAAQDAGNIDEAVNIFTKAANTDPSRALLWALVGSSNIASAKKDSDAAAKKQKFETAAGAYKKAIDLATASTDPKVKAGLGGYYNNYGEALGKSGKTPEAVAAYQAAGVADPANAAMYFFNEGATMENAFKIDEAVAAYDKSIAADPTRADSYFRKGIALLSKATTKGDKMIPAPGTEEAFNKYLELSPDGPNAETAKSMLTTIGAKVQTSYGTKSATKKK
jgi:tetratricopeptide (TPR) repeat protein